MSLGLEIRWLFSRSRDNSMSLEWAEILQVSPSTLFSHRAKDTKKVCKGLSGLIHNKQILIFQSFFVHFIRQCAEPRTDDLLITFSRWNGC